MHMSNSRNTANGAFAARVVSTVVLDANPTVPYQRTRQVINRILFSKANRKPPKSLLHQVKDHAECQAPR